MIHKLEPLPYSYGALEPHIDSATMKIHHDKHHQAYVDNLNKALQNNENLLKKSAEELIRDIKSVPKEIRVQVQNNGGGHVNHAFFWNMLKKDTKFKGEIADAIIKEFGSLDKFKELLKQAALSRFGSGWAWLVLNKGKLEIISTANQDNPLSEGKVPILGVDVWEHAYYLKYQNKRADYIDAFFSIINWDNVNNNLLSAAKKR